LKSWSVAGYTLHRDCIAVLPVRPIPKNQKREHFKSFGNRLAIQEARDEQLSEAMSLQDRLDGFQLIGDIGNSLCAELDERLLLEIICV